MILQWQAPSTLLKCTYLHKIDLKWKSHSVIDAIFHKSGVHHLILNRKTVPIILKVTMDMLTVDCVIRSCVVT